MTIPKEECRHRHLQFGSGDYYIFCHGCKRTWAMIDFNTHKVAPETANVGEGSQVSGEWRRQDRDA